MNSVPKEKTPQQQRIAKESAPWWIITTDLAKNDMNKCCCPLGHKPTWSFFLVMSLYTGVSKAPRRAGRGHGNSASHNDYQDPCFSIRMKKMIDCQK